MLPLPIPAEAVVVNPVIIDLAQRVPRPPVDHAEPFGVVHIQVRPTSGGDLADAAPGRGEPRHFEAIRWPEIPLADPVTDEAGRKSSAARDHSSEVLL